MRENTVSALLDFTLYQKIVYVQICLVKFVQGKTSDSDVFTSSEPDTLVGLLEVSLHVVAQVWHGILSSPSQNHGYYAAALRDVNLFTTELKWEVSDLQIISFSKANLALRI